ncbi:hypothetical protein V1477_016020 [Vespula maculifrons]|uniref:Uncharacterized protein n=1 Tax=Vespula maculifrons TaxID=7453 RepID=A0ABD2BBT5_VESMC
MEITGSRNFYKNQEEREEIPMHWACAIMFLLQRTKSTIRFVRFLEINNKESQKLHVNFHIHFEDLLFKK